MMTVNSYQSCVLLHFFVCACTHWMVSAQAQLLQGWFDEGLERVVSRHTMTYVAIVSYRENTRVANPYSQSECLWLFMSVHVLRCMYPWQTIAIRDRPSAQPLNVKKKKTPLLQRSRQKYIFVHSGLWKSGEADSVDTDSKHTVPQRQNIRL